MGWIVGGFGLGVVGRMVEGAEGGGVKERLRVVGSTPDVESLVKEVGGDWVSVRSLSRGVDDPHDLDLRPGLVRQVEEADLFVQVGLGLENAWLRDLMTVVRNPRVKPGGEGNLNLGVGVRPLEGEEGESIPGSYHEEGNPHYLLDPLEGLRVARVLRDRLTALRPEGRGMFAERCADFERRLGVWLVGEECARAGEVEVMSREFETLAADRLKAWAAGHGLGGWLGALVEHRGRGVVGDHDLWPYFARRSGLTVVGYLEPSPGEAPTAGHLRQLIDRMKREKVGLILSSPYFDRRHARMVARETGARILPMAHQTGGRPGAESYLAMVGYNGDQLLAGLRGEG